MNTVCPSQDTWPLACPCVDRHPTSQFRPALGFTFVHMPPRLILNWVGEFKKFIDTSHAPTGLRLHIVHSEAPQGTRIKLTEARWLWRRDVRSSRYVVISTYSSWSQVKYLFTEKIIWDEEVPGLTKAGNPHRPRLKTRYENRLYPAQQIMDECHEAKNPSTGAMSTFKTNAWTNGDCKTLFMSGTPWSQLPAELKGIFKVLETHEWPDHSRLQHACDQKLKELVVSYKRLLQKESEIETTPKLQSEMVKTTNNLAGILEMIMLRRTSAS